MQTQLYLELEPGANLIKHSHLMSLTIWQLPAIPILHLKMVNFMFMSYFVGKAVHDHVCF